MSLSQRLQQRQSQSLVMTPQLAQSIKLLQLNHLELMDFVRDEVEKNPLLELAQTDSDGLPIEARKAVSEDPTSGAKENANENVADYIASDRISAGDQLDASLENVFDTGTAGAEKAGKETRDNHRPSERTHGGSSQGDSNFDVLANMGKSIHLTDFLEEQIMLAFRDEEERKIATYIAHGLDEDGYFREETEETARQVGTTPDMVMWVLEKFQTLEPSGVGARNLAECMAIQLREKNRFDPAIRALVENLDLLARREFPKLMKLCGVDRDDFAEMVEEIRMLDPRPARSFEPSLAETVVPDVIISPTPIGDWKIELNPETLPRVLVDRDYHLELSTALKETDGEAFINECLDNANWLTRTLDQRAQTILKVAAEIVKTQDRFFAEGEQHLRPLTLKTVADAIKMHESTVSRVTSNKYLTCSRGTYELKFFFSSGLSSTQGDEDVSAEAVKYRIRQMIDAESTDKILSDEQIVQNLQETGIEIARRTVAKYREALHISSSVQRRREKTSRI